jgi:hypothetical protein
LEWLGKMCFDVCLASEWGWGGVRVSLRVFSISNFNGFLRLEGAIFENFLGEDI